MDTFYYETYASSERRVGKIGPQDTDSFRKDFLFQPDAVLSQQYFERLRRRAHLEGEKRLMLAVLEDGIAYFQKYCFACDKKGKERFREVQEWVLEQRDDWLLSFDNICEALEIHPDYLRRGLLEWREKQLEKRREVKRHGEMPGLRHRVR